MRSGAMVGGNCGLVPEKPSRDSAGSGCDRTRSFSTEHSVSSGNAWLLESFATHSRREFTQSSQAETAQLYDALQLCVFECLATDTQRQNRPQGAARAR